MTTPLPTRIDSAAHTREIDAALIAGGVPGSELMQRAAEAPERTRERPTTARRPPR